MPTYNFLPGVIVNTLDGGLTAAFAPQDDSILVIGTAGQGPVNTPFQVTDRAVAAQTFGFSGTLERAIEECATYSDNIIAFRMGAKPLELTGVGEDTTTGTATPGFGITFNGDVSSTAGTDYQVWYKAGVLSVWNSGTLVYSNVTNAAVDTGDITFTGTIAGNAGLQLGMGTTPALTGAITVADRITLRPSPLCAYKTPAHARGSPALRQHSSSRTPACMSRTTPWPRPSTARIPASLLSPIQISDSYITSGTDFALRTRGIPFSYHLTASPVTLPHLEAFFHPARISPPKSRFHSGFEKIPRCNKWPCPPLHADISPAHGREEPAVLAHRTYLSPDENSSFPTEKFWHGFCCSASTIHSGG